MTFDQIRLFRAASAVRKDMEAKGESPGAEEWTSGEKRLELVRRICERLVTDVDQEMIDVWLCFRKSGSVEGKNKIQLIVDVAELHGSKCFYANRGLGDCSEDVQLDRIKPGSRNGTYVPENCIIACGRHNAMRGDKAIEDFVAG